MSENREVPFPSAPKKKTKYKKWREIDHPHARKVMAREPLTYKYDYQYRFGSLLRAILGRDLGPHEDEENELLRRLDQHYELLKKHELYWISAFLVKKDTTFMGQRWKSGTSFVQQRLSFHVLHRGNICYIRMNEADPEKRFAEVEFFDFSRQEVEVVRVSADFIDRNWLHGKRLRRLPDDKVYDLRPRFRRLPFYKGPIRDGTLLEDCGLTAKMRQLLSPGRGKTVEEEIE